MTSLALALLLAQLAQPAPGGLAYPLGADLAAPGAVYQLGPTAPPPSLSWTPATPAASSVTADTVALWHLDETTNVDAVNSVDGGSVLSKNGSVTPVPGVFDGARRTSGGNYLGNFVDASVQNAIAAGSATIAYWAQRDANGIETYGAHVEIGDGTGAHYLLASYWSTSDYHWGIFWHTASGAGTVAIDTGYVLPLLGWHHYAITLTGTSPTCTVDAYVDGVSVYHGTGKTLPAPGGLAQKIFVGIGDNLVNAHNGAMDELQVLSRPLSAAEVLALYRRSGRWSSPPPSTLGPSLALTRASTGTYETAAGHIVNALSGELRCGYLGCPLEPTRTNRITQSAALDAWSKTQGGGASAIGVLANQLSAPDGTLAADKIDFPAVGSGGYAIVGQSGFTMTSEGLTWSIYGQTASGSVSAYLYAYDTTAGSYLGSTLCTWTTTESRCALTVTGTAGHGVNVWLGADCSGGSGMSPTSAGTVYAWGGQLEDGLYATSYIPTTTTAVTRAADVLSVADSVLGAGAASVHLALTPEWASSVDATLLASTTPNELGLATVSGTLDWLVGGNDIATGALGWSAGTAQAVDAWYSPGGAWRVTDGTHSASGVSAATPSPGGTLYLGGSSSAGAGVAISQIKVCKRAGVCR